jgi:serine protease Do
VAAEKKMQNRVYGFTALLLVIGLSITFGMILGGRLGAPQIVLAGPELDPIQLAPAATSGPDVGFADTVEVAIPAVVGVVSSKRATPEDDPHAGLDDPFFRRWFGEPDDDEERQRPDMGPRVGSGSGFVISPDGYIFTNNHVVDGYEKIEVMMQTGVTYDAKVVGTDPSIDLALLKVDAGDDDLPTLPLGDSEALRVGEWVIAIGNPLNFEQTVTVGVVSGKERRLPSLPTDSGVVSFIQTDAAINFGNSGGPLIDSRGNVVGINTAIRRANFAEGIGFALPINQARSVMEQLRQTGSVRRGYIGIRMNQNDIDQTTAEYYGLPDPNGVIVSEVTPKGPAAEAGLKVGDIIREVDGHKIKNNLDLIGRIASHQPGDKVKLDVYRSGESISMRATLGDRQEGLDADSRTRRALGGEPVEEQEPRQSVRLGLTVENPDARTLERLGFEPDQAGLIITDVAFGSDAADRGIQSNLLIVAVNETPTPNVASWEAALDELEPGSPVKLDVVAMGPGGPQPFYFFLRTPGSSD